MAASSSGSVVTMEAVREQLKLMGHQVPDEVIASFLDEAGFTQGQSLPGNTSQRVQSYSASFDVVPVQTARGNARRGSSHHSGVERSDTARSFEGSLHSAKQSKCTSAVGNRKGVAFGDTSSASPSDRSSSSLVSGYEASHPRWHFRAGLAASYCFAA